MSVFFQNIDKTLFWDSDFNNLSLKKDYYYLISRILNRGDYKDRKLMFDEFSLDQIKFVVQNNRELPNALKTILLEVINEKRSDK